MTFNDAGITAVMNRLVCRVSYNRIRTRIRRVMQFCYAELIMID